MIDAVLESLPIAIALIVATLPMLAVPLILAAQARAGALLGFLGGWGLGFLALGGVVIAFSDLTAREPTAPAVWVVWARLILGLVLIWLAWRKWQSRPQPGDDLALPGWMAAMETMAPARAVAVAFLLVVVNPKNAVLVISGALAIASASQNPAAQAGALAVFTLVSSLGIAAPLALRLVLGPAAAEPLTRLKTFIARHNKLIMALVLLVIGLIVIAKALSDMRS